MYSKENYKSEQQPGDQLLGGSTALCCSSGASREKRKKLSERETFNAVENKKVKRERERVGNQNKSGLQSCAESWSGKTEQIMVAGNKILLINRNGEERDIKTQRLMQKKNQLRIVTMEKCRRREVWEEIKVIWKKRKSVRHDLFEVNLTRTTPQEENERCQKIS